MKILAIDFETADNGRDSACAIGLAMLEGGRIIDEHYELIRPPRSEVWFTDTHGLTWEDLADKPVFAEVWPRILPMLMSADAWAAHNASFDRAVLTGCAVANNLALPARPWLCTLQLSRAAWALPSHSLSNVCAHLDIALDHHHALSDARGCAAIVTAANNQNHQIEKYIRHY